MFCMQIQINNLFREISALAYDEEMYADNNKLSTQHF